MEGTSAKNVEPATSSENTADGPLTIEEITEVIHLGITAGVTDRPYDKDRASEYVKEITEAILHHISALRSTNCKYFVHVVIVENIGAGIHQTIGALWNCKKDDFVTVPFTNDQMNVIVTVCQLPVQDLPPLLTASLEEK